MLTANEIPATPCKTADSPVATGIHVLLLSESPPERPDDQEAEAVERIVKKAERKNRPYRQPNRWVEGEGVELRKRGTKEKKRVYQEGRTRFDLLVGLDRCRRHGDLAGTAVLHYWLFMSKILPPPSCRSSQPPSEAWNANAERTTPGRGANARSGSLLAYPRDTEDQGV